VILDEEFVVHNFAPIDGPRAATAYRHRLSVLELVGFLRVECGIDAEVDRYFEAHRQAWSRWARNQIRTADFVIVIASPRLTGQ